MGSADLAADKAVKELKAANEKAAEYADKLQELIDGMDVTESGYEQYVQRVTALQDEINGQDPAVKTLMYNSSYLAEKVVGEKTTVLLLTAQLYYDRAETFKSTVATITENSPETEWDALNALYEKSATVSGITVPAIDGNETLETAVGAETVETYLTKRAAHESAVASKLTADIAQAKTEFEQATDRTGRTAALTKIVNEFKPTYDKLPDTLKEDTGYQDFVAEVYQKNLDDVIDSYKEIKSELEALTAQGSEASIESLLSTMRKLSSAYGLYVGYDYWTSNMDNDATKMPWGKTWITALKPTWLEETALAELNQKVTEVTALNRELIKGTVETALGTALKEVIGQAVAELYGKIGSCRIVSEEDGTVTWDFSTLSLDNDAKAALLDRIHGLRFLISKVLPTTIINDIWGNDPKDEMWLFVQINLTQFEAQFETYVAAASAPQA